jgi:hypothetical protein
MPDRDPDRGLQRQRVVREERRRIPGAFQHDEAGDGGSGVQRVEEGRTAHRRVPHQRERLAQRRRPSGGSTMFAAIHSKVSVDDLLHGAIIQSGNDACIALAEGMAAMSVPLPRTS